MANKQPKIHSFGYDSFIGREIFKDRHESFVSLDFSDLSAVSCSSLDFMLYYLCDQVKKGKKVLLCKSPGEKGPTKHASPTGEYIIAGRKYEPLKPEQMNYFRKMYRLETEMKRFPDPFNA
jgi:hypothetical protein